MAGERIEGGGGAVIRQGKRESDEDFASRSTKYPDVNENAYTFTDKWDKLSPEDQQRRQGRGFDWLVDNGYAEKSGYNPNDPWQKYVDSYVKDKLGVISESFGLDGDAWNAWYAGKKNQMMQYVYENWTYHLQGLDGDPLNGGMGTKNGYDIEYGGLKPTTGGLETLGKAAFAWLTSMDDSNTLKWSFVADSYKARAGQGPRGSGSGRKGPSMADFDLDAMAENVSSMWRALLLDDTKNARGIATEYARAIIKNPNQELDFEQFVLNKIRATSRHKSIYRNKPEHLDERGFLNRYQQSAASVLRPENVDDVAIMGAQLGADPTAYGDLLTQQREVYTSSPWINQFQDRLTNLKGLFRG